MVNSLRQTVHTHLVSALQAAKLLATLLRLVRVTAGLVESNDGTLTILTSRQRTQDYSGRYINTLADSDL